MVHASVLPDQKALPSPGELRDHVLSEIARTCGPQLPVARSQEVIDGFWLRFGPEDGMAICDQAFTVHGGMWRGAPVTVLRFQQGHDEYFAGPLLKEARAASAGGSGGHA